MTIANLPTPAYGEIKDFYAWITTSPHIITIFNIIVVDLPPAYGVVMRRDWTSMIGGYIMNDGSCMMLSGKDGVMIKLPREPRKPFSFKKKDNELMEDYIYVGIGKYAILDMEHNEIQRKFKVWGANIVCFKATGGCQWMEPVLNLGTESELFF